MRFHRAFEMNELIAVKVVAFDAEQNEAIVRGRYKHDRRFLPGAKGVFIDDYFEPAMSITKLRAAARCHPHRRLCLDWCAFVVAGPRDSIVALALRREAERSLLSVGPYALGRTRRARSLENELNGFVPGLTGGEGSLSRSFSTHRLLLSGRLD